MIDKVGSLVVITGSMFAGKTEKLIRRVRRALYARRTVQVFKHALNTRAEGAGIRSHNGTLYSAVPVSSGKELLHLVEGKPAPASAPTALLGAQESYEARCRCCHGVPE